jgi:hypothetical protein
MKRLMSLGMFFLLSTSTASFASGYGHGSISCDPVWPLCLQSMSTDPKGTIHYVHLLSIHPQKEKQYFMPQFGQLTIEDQSGNVLVTPAGATSIVLGQISEPVGEDKALARGLNLDSAYTLKLTSLAGKDTTQCNETAVGLFERVTYHTKINKLSVVNSKTEDVVAAVDSYAVNVAPGFNRTTTSVPCK